MFAGNRTARSPRTAPAALAAGLPKAGKTHPGENRHREEEEDAESCGGAQALHGKHRVEPAIDRCRQPERQHEARGPDAHQHHHERRRCFLPQRRPHAEGCEQDRHDAREERVHGIGIETLAPRGHMQPPRGGQVARRGCRELPDAFNRAHHTLVGGHPAVRNDDRQRYDRGRDRSQREPGQDGAAAAPPLADARDKREGDRDNPEDDEVARGVHHQAHRQGQAAGIAQMRLAHEPVGEEQRQGEPVGMNGLQVREPRQGVRVEGEQAAGDEAAGQSAVHDTAGWDR